MVLSTNGEKLFLIYGNINICQIFLKNLPYLVLIILRCVFMGDFRVVRLIVLFLILVVMLIVLFLLECSKCMVPYRLGKYLQYRIEMGDKYEKGKKYDPEDDDTDHA